ncbi:hypothetical protein MNV49_001096 [Pseudohyphozyma bogoriensis]|nr:hypothetical protein MNV49_001096 [Pseudohyphozyma bogoriensis]
MAATATLDLNPFLSTAATPAPVASTSTSPLQLATPAVPLNRDFPAVWSQFLENVWDEEDFEVGLLALEGLVGRAFRPSPSQIQQLLALSLHPSQCVPTNSKRVHAPTLDPYTSTLRKVRLEALRLLDDIGHTNGGESVARGTPGYEQDEDLLDTQGKAEQAKKRAMNSPSKKAKKRREEEEDEEEGNKAVNAAARRVGVCEEVWDLLAGGSGMGKEFGKSSRERPVSRTGWDLVRSLVAMWEGEAKERKGKGLPEFSPSLLRQFKPTALGPREVSSKALDILLWPFTYGIEHSLAEAENMEEDGDTKVEDDPEMDLGEKQRVAARLMALLAQLALTSRVDASAFVSLLSNRLELLSSSSISTFLCATTLTTSPTFLIRFLTTYLELFSHSTRPANSQPNGSPRRRTLGSESSLSSLSSSSLPQLNSTSNGLPVSAAAPTPAPAVPQSFFALPTPPAFLALFSRVPTAVSLADNSSTTPTVRRPKGSKPSYGKVAAERFEVVKIALAEVGGEVGGGLEDVLEEGEVEAKMEEVRKIVEEARKRVESA